MRPLFAVAAAGAPATVQDLGRTGHQRTGMVAGGAMDAFALQVANLLVGNERGAAALEVGAGRLTLRALDAGVAAVCGAPLGAELGGRPAPLWRSFAFGRGQELAWRGASAGAWAYLAVAGGIEVEPVLGSRSTYLRAGLGGLGGRVLRVGDELSAGEAPRRQERLAGRALAPADLPPVGPNAAVRTMRGPDFALLGADSAREFFSAEYRVTPRSDRMGYRLSGPALERPAGAEALSEPVAAGAVQAPPDGQPILLMADRQTCGGYPVVAAVASADLPLAAQVRPGGTIRFVEVSLDAAQELAAAREELLRVLESACRDARP